MRRDTVWLLAGTLALAPLAAAADAWDARDVEAAERYREIERERAARYREGLARRSQPVARAPRAEPPLRRPVRAAPPRDASRPSWWTGLSRAGVAEEDLHALRDWIDRVGGWTAFWQAEVEPRWQRWRELAELRRD